MKIWLNNAAFASLAGWIRSLGTPTDSFFPDTTTKIAAFTDSITYDPTLNFALLNEPVFTGYTAGGLALTSWSAVISPDGRIKFFTGAPVYTVVCTAAPGSPVPIRGFVIYDTADDDGPACIMLLDQPLTIDTPGQGWSIEAQVALQAALVNWGIG